MSAPGNGFQDVMSLASEVPLDVAGNDNVPTIGAQPMPPPPKFPGHDL
jgi:hypothetical protein